VRSKYCVNVKTSQIAAVGAPSKQRISAKLECTAPPHTRYNPGNQQPRTDCLRHAGVWPLRHGSDHSMVHATSTRFTIEETMSFTLKPWQFFFVILVGWVHREQQKIIEFYRQEVETLMKSQGKKRLLLTDDQGRLLAVKGKSLGRKALMELTTIVTPDTILRWHRQLVAQ
jgi:hypothetical protein